MEALIRVFGTSCGQRLARTLRTPLCRHQAGATPLVLSQLKRHYAEPGNYIKVERDSAHEEIAIVKMDRRQANSMSKDFVTELNITLEKLENNNSYRGVILTSTKPGIFSAGVDINELYQKSPDYSHAFFRSLQDLWLRLYGSDLATVAAIIGHAPAGGCMLALSCDYRIMAQGKYTIGLNEVFVGIIVPFWLQEMMAKVCSVREMEIGVQLGTLYTPEKALKIGMVDEIAPMDDVIPKAREQLVKWLQIPDHARVITKGMVRRQLMEKLRVRQDEEATFLTEFINKDSSQKIIGEYLDRLKNKKK